MEFEHYGHTVKQIAPQFVKPFLKSNKNDANDAEAIVEAASRPGMRFVMSKQPWQRDLQSVHNHRARVIRSQTALINNIHAFLLEYGLIVTKAQQSRLKFKREILEIANDDDLLAQMTFMSKRILKQMILELDMIEEQLVFYSEELRKIAKENEDCKRLQTIPGVGEITSTAVICMIPNLNSFKNGRDLSAWLGLVPRQHSSGGKEKLLGISKRGNGYLRYLFVHGARSVLRVAPKKSDRLNRWAIEKSKTRGMNKAIVAVANKNVRIAFRILKNQEEYKAVA